MNFSFRFAFPSSCPPSLGLPLQYLVTSHSHNLLSLSPFFLFLPRCLVETTLVSHQDPLGASAFFSPSTPEPREGCWRRTQGPARGGTDKTESEEKIFGSLSVAVAFSEPVWPPGADTTLQFRLSFRCPLFNLGLRGSHRVGEEKKRGN